MSNLGSTPVASGEPVRGAKHRTFFDRPTVKQVGIVVFVGLLGFAAGNGHKTAEAMAGQAQWLNDRCGKTIKAKVQQHIQKDRQVFGYAPEDIAPPRPR